MAAAAKRLPRPRDDRRDVALPHAAAGLARHRAAPDDRPRRLGLAGSQLEPAAGERLRAQRQRAVRAVHVRDDRQLRPRLRSLRRRTARGGARGRRAGAGEVRPARGFAGLPQRDVHEDLPGQLARLRADPCRGGAAVDGARAIAEARAGSARAFPRRIRSRRARGDRGAEPRAARASRAGRRGAVARRGRGAAGRTLRRRTRRTRRTRAGPKFARRADRRGAARGAAAAPGEPAAGPALGARRTLDDTRRRRCDLRAVAAARAAGGEGAGTQAAAAVLRARRTRLRVERPADRGEARRLVETQRRLPDPFRLGNGALRDDRAAAHARAAGHDARASTRLLGSHARPADRGRRARAAGRADLGRDEGQRRTCGRCAERSRPDGRRRTLRRGEAEGVLRRAPGRCRAACRRTQRRLDLPFAFPRLRARARRADLRVGAIPGAGGAHRHFPRPARRAHRRRRCRAPRHPVHHAARLRARRRLRRRLSQVAAVSGLQRARTSRCCIWSPTRSSASAARRSSAWRRACAPIRR